MKNSHAAENYVKCHNVKVKAIKECHPIALFHAERQVVRLVLLNTKPLPTAVLCQNCETD